jgi:hypothetical protein
LNNKIEKKTKIQQNKGKIISITTKIHVIYWFIKLLRTQNWTKIMTKKTKIMQKQTKKQNKKKDKKEWKILTLIACFILALN